MRKFLLATAILMLPALASAQGRIAVVDLQAAILKTDFAEARLNEFKTTESIAADLAELESLADEYEGLGKDFERDQAAMSEDQRTAAVQKITSKQADIQYINEKLQKQQQQFVQGLLEKMYPKARQVLAEVIETEQIGLLLNYNPQLVIHADLGYNVTAKVTDKLNQLPQE